MSPLTLELAKLNWKDSISIARRERKKMKSLKKKLKQALAIQTLYNRLKKNSLPLEEKEQLTKDLTKKLKLDKKYDIKNGNDYNLFMEAVKEKISTLPDLKEYGIGKEFDIKSLDSLLFDEADLQKTLEFVSVLTLQDEIWINDYLKLKFFNSAHIE
jgi:tRNA U34 5-carboxymethylaminomethyl modifying enzyme MnmG/GidA